MFSVPDPRVVEATADSANTFLFLTRGGTCRRKVAVWLDSSTSLVSSVRGPLRGEGGATLVLLERLDQLSSCDKIGMLLARVDVQYLASI